MLSLNDALVEIGEDLIDFMDIRRWGDEKAPSGTEAGQALYETDLIDEARRYMKRGRNRGATLEGLTRYLEPASELARDDLVALIQRHFVVDGDLVFLPGEYTLAAAAGLPDSVEAHLRALGYEDLRRDVPLERVEDDASRARLVGYVDGKPVLLVFVAPPGKVGDPLVEEDARFQAKAMSRDFTPRIVYFTDGSANRYLMLDDDQVVSELPRAARAGDQQPSKGKGAS